MTRAAATSAGEAANGRSSADCPDRGRNVAALVKRSLDGRRGYGGHFSHPFSARRALRITATSIPSWSRAPATGGRYPNAAKPIAINDAPIPEQDTLLRDVQRTAAERDGIGNAVDAVDENDGIRSLRGDGRTSRAHRDADVGERQRGRVVDPVAHHHDRVQLRLRLKRAHDIELLVRRLLGVDAIDAEPLAHRLRHRSLVARNDRDMPDPHLAQTRHEPVGVGTELISN